MRMKLLQITQYFGCGIGRTVVRNYNFIVSVSLIQTRFDSVQDDVLLVVGDDKNTYEWIGDVLAPLSFSV